jgi:hypothetical protein
MLPSYVQNGFNGFPYVRDTLAPFAYPSFVARPILPCSHQTRLQAERQRPIDVRLYVITDHHRFSWRRSEIAQNCLKERWRRLAKQNRLGFCRIFQGGDEWSGVEAEPIGLLKIAVRRNRQQGRAIDKKPEGCIESLISKTIRGITDHHRVRSFLIKSLEFLIEVRVDEQERPQSLADEVSDQGFRRREHLLTGDVEPKTPKVIK